VVDKASSSYLRYSGMPVQIVDIIVPGFQPYLRYSIHLHTEHSKPIS